MEMENGDENQGKKRWKLTMYPSWKTLYSQQMAHSYTITLRRVSFTTSMRNYFVSIDHQIYNQF